MCNAKGIRGSRTGLKLQTKERAGLEEEEEKDNHINSQQRNGV